MINVILPDRRKRRLPFFLAMEEWVAKRLDACNYIFTWIVSPTVICGRNQDIEKEVNLPYCRQHGIDVVRRRSGGGCVYADHNNIMISFITPDTDVETTFAQFTNRIAGQLRAIGINAEATGRNDIMVDGRKISGNAFLHLPGRSIIHGTMLYDTDPESMRNAITPSRAKLESKRVLSVENRVITAHELLPDMPIDVFHNALLSGLITGQYLMSDDDIREVEAIEQEYYRPEWLWRQKHDETRPTHIDGVGEFVVRVDIDEVGLIRNILLKGDFFETSDSLSSVLNCLKGIKPEYEPIKKALADTDIRNIIAGLSTDNFINLITDKNNHYGTDR